ncbi:NHL repeat-containing protein [Gorillibacterium timonense]|uniref:SMP-30/gluconolactonase/LRE family protein n=1 Tax=Gorillibacterium timonense TaxID=1689269 RepID=UPI00071DC674|nr:SMP-30/gluconolactonase/LRE family protein [Gorillibacterium timonense]
MQLTAKKWLLSMAAASLLFTAGAVPAQAASKAPYESYNYGYYIEALPAPAAYLPSFSLSGDDLGIGSFVEPNDLYTTEAGVTYLLDSGNARIVIIGADWKLIKEITGFDNNGKADGFKKPSGIFVDQDGDLYVADTDNQRVVVLDPDGKLVKIVQEPKSDILAEGFKFVPLKVTVDKAKRIFVVAQGVYEGIMQFDEKGEFLGYAGTIKVQRDYGDYIWRRLSTKAQKAQMTLFIPTEFSNLDIDHKGFVYATNIDTGSEQPIKRLNPSGADVLKRYGYFAVAGDVYYRRAVGPSKFVDIKVLGDGMYSALDSTQGRVFTYDNEGDLLYVFGGKGNQLGTLKTPVAVEKSGESMIVLDRGKSNLVVYEPTIFGKHVNEAIKHHYAGDDGEAVASWQEVLKLNANYDIAYNGIGKAKLLEKDNKKAMEYFKLGMDRKNYSVAFKRYRTEVLKENFGTYMTVFIVLVVGILIARPLLKWRRRRVTNRAA